MNPNFDQFEYLAEADSFSEVSFGHLNPLEEKLNLGTDAPQNESIFISRSNKKANLVSKSMRSIQNYSMDEHKAYILRITQELWNSIHQKNEGEDRNCWLKKFEENQKISVEEFIRNSRFLSQEQKSQLIEDLKLEQDLKCFLEILCQNFNQELADQLTLVSYECWEYYIQLRESELEPFQQELIRTSGINCASKLNLQFFNQWEHDLKQSNRDNDFKSKIALFLTDFCQTVLFVIAGYFYNPMLQQIFTTQIVSSQSHFTMGNQEESDASFGCLPTKKRKTQ